jgi:hypothetical protein
MKVQVTVNVSDEARMGISMAQVGDIKLASRDICRDWIQDKLVPELAAVEEAVEKIKQEILSNLELERG